MNISQRTDRTACFLVDSISELKDELNSAMAERQHHESIIEYLSNDIRDIQHDIARLETDLLNYES